MRTLKQSTARTIAVFMTDSTDHVSGKTGLTLTITASKAGATFASITPTVTELANGWYAVALTASHTDTLGDLAMHVTATGADPTDLLGQVVAVDFADAQRLGLAVLPATGTLAVKPAVTLAAADVSGNVAADVQTIKTQAVTAPAAVTFPGTISSYAGGAVASVTGSVGSIAGVTFPTNFSALSVTAAGVVRAFNDAGAALASHADVLAINTSSSKHLILTTVGQYERPESGTATYTVECRTFSAADGTAVNADATPTLTATGSISGDVSVNIAAATNPATGVYRFEYTVASTATVEQIRLDVSATISSATFTLSAYTQVADFVAATFTTADRTLLTDTNTRVLLALPAAAPAGANGLPILGTNTAGIVIQPLGGDAVRLSTGSGFALNARGSTGSTFVATGLGSAALTCTPGTGGVGIIGDIQGDLLGSANILYQTAVVTAATANTVTLSSPVSGPPSTTPGAYVGGVFWVKSGTGSRQVRTITAYDSVNRIVTVDRPWDTAPDATSIGQILAGQEYAANAATASTPMTLTTAERDAVAAALLDLANGIESGKTLRQAMRLMAAGLAGKRSNAGTNTEQYDAIGNPGTARIVGNLDASGNGEPTLTP